MAKIISSVAMITLVFLLTQWLTLDGYRIWVAIVLAIIISASSFVNGLEK